MLGTYIEEEFEKGGRLSQGVKQRNEEQIWVLQATAMPSILVETGFITNPDEERYLNSESGQVELATCITNALGNYIAWLQKKQTPGNPSVYLPDQPSSGKIEESFLEALDNHQHMGR